MHVHKNYGQRSIFESINQQGIGTFNANGRMLTINQTINSSNDFEEATDFNRESATSVAFTLGYKSPVWKHFTFYLSYSQAATFQETSSDTDILENGTYGVLNTGGFKYHLKGLGFKEGTITLGRFLLDTEFMTDNQLRQKKQSYEGVFLNIPTLEHWSFKLGYLSKFSSWKSTTTNFKSIEAAYGIEGEEGATELYNGSQFFTEIRYLEPEKMDLILYYIQTTHKLHITGFSYLKHIFSIIDAQTHFAFKAKGIFQWGTHKKSLITSIGGLQAGVLLKRNSLIFETGIFTITGNQNKDENKIRAPFGPKLIISNPLLGTDSDYKEGNDSYYIESSYRFSNTKLYALYLHTNSYQSNHNEIDLVVNQAFNKHINSSIKIGYLDQSGFNLIDNIGLEINLLYEF